MISMSAPAVIMAAAVTDSQASARSARAPHSGTSASGRHGLLTFHYVRADVADDRRLHHRVVLQERCQTDALHHAIVYSRP